MRTFIFLTFVVLAWAFWELSGGADYAPETRPEPAPAVEPVPEPAPEPAPAPAPEPAGAAAPAPEPAPFDDAASALSAAAPEPAAEPAPLPEPPAAPPAAPDMRIVTASRANLRAGAGTDFDVVTTLSAGAEVEVLGTADGWVQVRIPETGVEAWISEKLISAP